MLQDRKHVFHIIRRKHFLQVVHFFRELSEGFVVVFGTPIYS